MKVKDVSKDEVKDYLLQLKNKGNPQQRPPPPKK